MPDPVELFFDILDPRMAHAISERGSYTFEREGGFYVVRKRFDRSGYHLQLLRSGPDDQLLGSCSCPDFQYRGAGRAVPCKHLWIAAEFLGLVQFPRDAQGHVLPPAPAASPKPPGGDG